MFNLPIVQGSAPLGYQLCPFALCFVTVPTPSSCHGPVILLDIWRWHRPCPSAAEVITDLTDAWHGFLTSFSNPENCLVATTSVTVGAKEGTRRGEMSLEGCRSTLLPPGPSLKGREVHVGVSPGNCFGHREGDSKQQISSPIRVPILQMTKAKAEARIILLFIQSYCCLSVLLKKKPSIHPPTLLSSFRELL